MTDENEKPKKETPGGIVSMADQAEAGTEAFALVVSTYYRNLVLNRIDPDHALALTLEYQRIMLTMGRPQ